MRSQTRRVDKLMKRYVPDPLGPFRVWFSYDDGTPPKDKPTEEEVEAIEAAGGTVFEVRFVSRNPLILPPTGWSALA